MTNILKSLFVVVAVAAVAGGATWAYFTDTETVSGNTFAAGTLDFKLNGDLTASNSVNLGNMIPGEWYGPYKMEVYNELSTMPIKYRFQDGPVSESVPGFYDKLNVKVEHGYCIGGTEYINETYEQIHTLRNMLFESPSGSITAPTGSLGTNISHCFKLSFQLDPSAGNALQGGSAVANIVVDGTQVNNPGWAE
jgi:predicted ribosomally synthesized peptide with SipW-like signal peptide